MLSQKLYSEEEREKERERKKEREKAERGIGKDEKGEEKTVRG